MQIKLEKIGATPDGRQEAHFKARFGRARGIWRGKAVRVGQVFQIEFTLLDELEVGRNFAILPSAGYDLRSGDDLTHLTVRVESIDPDDVAYLRLGDDCLFFAEFIPPSPQPSQWLRITVPVGRLEIWPYDEGEFTVREG